MNRSLFAKIVVIVLVLSPSFVRADGDAGQAGEILRHGVGARAFGLGQAYVSLASDASAIYWNPGGLSFVDRWEATFMHSNLFLDTRYNYWAGVYPFSFGHLGLGMVDLSVQDFERRDENNRLKGEFSVGETAFLLSGGWKVNRIPYFEWMPLIGRPRFPLGFGVTLKYLRQSIDNDSEGGWGGSDFGIVGAWPRFRLKGGLVWQTKGDLGPDPIPWGLRAGLSWIPLRRITVSLDCQGTEGRSPRYSFGSEFEPMGRWLCGRVGINAAELSLGFGLNLLRIFKFDYAYVHHRDDLGGSHWFSLTYGARPEGPETMYRNAKDEEKRGNIAQAKELYIEIIRDYAESADFENERKWAAKSSVALGDLAFSSRGWREARGRYGEADGITPSDTWGEVFEDPSDRLFMESHMHLEGWNQAIEVSGKCDVMNRPAVQYDLGICHLRVGKFEEAQAYFERTRDLAVRGGALHWLSCLKVGEVLKELGRCSEAVPILRDVAWGYEAPLTDYPQFPGDGQYDVIADDAFYLMGECYEREGTIEEARRAYANVLRFFYGVDKDLQNEAHRKVNELMMNR